MNFELSPSQRLVQQTAREFSDRRLRPIAAELDRESRFPREILRELADLGMMAINVPASYGGSEAGAIAYALAMIEIARGCASTAVTMSVTNMVGEVIALLGSEEQKQTYLPRLASGEYAAGAFALSEPEAGSDPASMRATATRTAQGDYEINGQKQWITSGAYAGVILVMARTGGPGAKGISCFLVEGGAEGMRVGKPEQKMGLRASNTVPLTFEGCRVPASAMLGEVNVGFQAAMKGLGGGRIGIACQALGIATSALDEAVRYARDRKQFGKAIAEFQGVQWPLADSRLELDAARALILRAAFLKESGKPHAYEASMAKLYATEVANRVCNRAVQVLGGYGYTRDFSVERHLRDVRATTIYEGTSEVQKIVIARNFLR